jgi:glycosyltransferase involved in cell wall biosynthesis
MKRASIGLLSGHALDLGGVERYLLSLVGALSPANSLYVLGVMSTSFASTVVQAGGTPIEWRTGFPYDRRSVRALTHHVQDLGLQLIHVQDLPALLTAGWAGHSLKIPVIRTVHQLQHITIPSTTPRDKLRRAYYYMLEVLANHYAAQQIILVSHRVLKSPRMRFAVPNSRTHVIPNGVEVPKPVSDRTRAQTRSELGLAPGEIMVLFVGRLERDKGVDVLLRASAQVRDPRVRLWLIGEGSQRQDLEALTHQLGIHHRVKFVGEVRQVWPYLMAADLFTLPSYYEGLSYAVLEALSAGLPCLVSDVSDHQNMIGQRGAGLVVAVGSIAETAEALQQLVADVELRNRCRHAALRVIEDYSLETMLQRTKDVYQALLKIAEPNDE